MVDLNLSITDNASPEDNDGQEDVSAGTWDERTSTYPIGHYFEVVDHNAAARTNGGLRFEGITIDSTATINSATLGFTIDSYNASFDVNISLDDTNADAAAWGNSSRPSSGFAASTNSPISKTISSVGAQTVDVTALIQDALAISGWANGNAVRFGVFAPTTGSYRHCNIDDWESDDTTTVATLDITYTAAGGGGTILLHLMSYS